MGKGTVCLTLTQAKSQKLQQDRGASRYRDLDAIYRVSHLVIKPNHSKMAATEFIRHGAILLRFTKIESHLINELTSE